MFEKVINLFKKNELPEDEVKKILVVEDSEIDLKIIVNILKKHNFDITIAINGQEGLLTANQLMPDLILLDCEMPVLNGIETCKQLKANSKTCKIPVLFLTGVTTPANVIECFEAEAENYLEKPVDAKVLISEIEILLSKKQ